MPNVENFVMDPFSALDTAGRGTGRTISLCNAPRTERESDLLADIA
jgi:hypothetical protein